MDTERTGPSGLTADPFTRRDMKCGKLKTLPILVGKIFFFFFFNQVSLISLRKTFQNFGRSKRFRHLQFIYITTHIEHCVQPPSAVIPTGVNRPFSEPRKFWVFFIQLCSKFSSPPSNSQNKAFFQMTSGERKA